MNRAWGHLCQAQIAAQQATGQAEALDLYKISHHDSSRLQVSYYFAPDQIP
jgi:DUF1680 family protein